MPSMNMRAYIAGLIAFAIKHVSRRVGFAMAGVGATALAVVAIIESISRRWGAWSRVARL
jgi:hypothetical protein